MELVLSLALAVVSAGFLLRPLLRGTGRLEPVGDDERTELLVERDTLYEAIRDLELDHLAGKIEKSEYDAMRARFEADAIRVLHRLDEWSEEQPVIESPTIEEDALELEIQRFKHSQEAVLSR